MSRCFGEDILAAVAFRPDVHTLEQDFLASGYSARLAADGDEAFTGYTAVNNTGLVMLSSLIRYSAHVLILRPDRSGWQSCIQYT